MNQIRELFATPIDRPIEKVIDYAAADDERLGREIDEYVVTERLEDSFRKFIEVYESGVRRGDVTEVGIWVSGFYGSGKSSFTKYLGLAMDPTRRVLDRLASRFHAQDLQQFFRKTAREFPASVVLLDLAREQLVESTATPITNVLYAKVLQTVGYSKVAKIADVELRLDESGRLGDFRAAYRSRFPGKGEWDDVHDDPLIGPARAAQLVPTFLPDDFSTPESFRQQHYQLTLSVSDLAERMIRLLRKKTNRQNILFLVDEVGQYVAPRTDLMLNLDGLVRSFKELGRGKVWFVATAQQALKDVVERAVINSAELYRLKDRFENSIQLSAADIREITHRRLLTKRAEGERHLLDAFRSAGEVLKLSTRVEGFDSLTPGELDARAFAQMYPFLPLHFDLVMALIRRLARRAGGTGLRSAIRVVQDLLVDASRALPAGVRPVADRPVGRLACADDLFDTLRADLGKELPHVLEGVDRVTRHAQFGSEPLSIRVAKAIAALQPLDEFPRTAENLAAVLYPATGEPSLVEPVRDVLKRLVEARELGIVEVRPDPDAGPGAPSGYLFLSDKVRPLQQARDAYRPTGAERRALHVDLLRGAFDPQPEARLEDVRSVFGGLTYGTVPVVEARAEIRFLLEHVSASDRDRRLQELRYETRARPELAQTIVWLVTPPADLDELLDEACRSAHLTRTTSEHDPDPDVAQFVRSEARRLERTREMLEKRLAASLHEGWFVFQALDRPVRELGAEGVIAAASAMLARAASDVFHQFRLAPLRAMTERATRFLEWERLDRMPPERDPLRLVESGTGRIRIQEPPLSEVWRAFNQKVDATGAGRLQGSYVLDLFAAAPYGWNKDTTRYLFAALLAGGQIEVHAPSGILRTGGPQAIEAFRNTASFARLGIAPRGSRPSLDVLDRAARLLEGVFGIEVLPLEDHISKAVRKCVPSLLESVGALPDRLRLLGLPGEERARSLLASCSDLIREDAGGAASILGTPDSTVPGDVRWARSAAECLGGGGEAEVRQASVLRQELLELAHLYPEAAAVARPGPMDTIRDVLATEVFFERLPDLRGAMLDLQSSLRYVYAAERARLESAIAQGRDGVQAMARWQALDSEDQSAILSRLSMSDLPPEPSDADLLRDLRRLLARSARLPGVLLEIQEEVRRHSGPTLEPDPTDEPAGLQRIAVSSLLPAEALCDAPAVDRWIEDLRTRLLELVELGPVRLLDREDD